MTWSAHAHRTGPTHDRVTSRPLWDLPHVNPSRHSIHVEARVQGDTRGHGAGQEKEAQTTSPQSFRKPRVKGEGKRTTHRTVHVTHRRSCRDRARVFFCVTKDVRRVSKVGTAQTSSCSGVWCAHPIQKIICVARIRPMVEALMARCTAIVRKNSCIAGTASSTSPGQMLGNTTSKEFYPGNWKEGIVTGITVRLFPCLGDISVIPCVEASVFVFWW